MGEVDEEDGEEGEEEEADVNVTSGPSFGDDDVHPSKIPSAASIISGEKEEGVTNRAKRNCLCSFRASVSERGRRDGNVKCVREGVSANLILAGDGERHALHKASVLSHC